MKDESMQRKGGCGGKVPAFLSYSQSVHLEATENLLYFRKELLDDFMSTSPAAMKLFKLWGCSKVCHKFLCKKKKIDIKIDIKAGDVWRL